MKASTMLAGRVLLILAGLIIQNEASRILAVFPTPSISHQVVFRPLIKELINRGHEVVLLTTDPMYKKGEAPKNLTEIDVHDISYDTWRKGIYSAKVTSGSKDDFREQGSQMFYLLKIVLEQQLLTSEMQAILNDKSNKYDLLLLEAFYTPVLAFTTVFKAPVIQISSFGPILTNIIAMGMPTHSFIYPDISQQKFINLTMWDKISAIYNNKDLTELMVSEEEKAYSELKYLFGSDEYSLEELKNNVDMLFVNIHPIWDSNRPVPPNVVFMGGIHQNPEKELPQDLKQYLDLSKHGVIYISFGTNVEPSLLPPQKIQTIIDVFSKLPYDILWKWNKDVLPGQTKNIRISKWLPQSDLLRHPNVKLFITQGGLQSTDEAITAGVPLIGMPMLGDQWYNVEQYVKLKIGLRIDMDTITAHKLDSAIKTIIEDKSYRDNINKLRTIMHDQPQTPLERATWWTEYVLRHGGAKHLRSPAANMPWTEYYEIELLTYILVGVLSVVIFVLFVVYFIFSRLFFSRTVQPKLKKR